MNWSWLSFSSPLSSAPPPSSSSSSPSPSSSSSSSSLSSSAPPSSSSSSSSLRSRLSTLSPGSHWWGTPPSSVLPSRRSAYTSYSDQPGSSRPIYVGYTLSLVYVYVDGYSGFKHRYWFINSLNGSSYTLTLSLHHTLYINTTHSVSIQCPVFNVLQFRKRITGIKLYIYVASFYGLSEVSTSDGCLKTVWIVSVLRVTMDLKVCGILVSLMIYFPKARSGKSSVNGWKLDLYQAVKCLEENHIGRCFFMCVFFSICLFFFSFFFVVVCVVVVVVVVLLFSCIFCICS